MPEIIKVSELTELNETPAAGDIVHIIDVSDDTYPGGTSKKITFTNLVKNYVDGLIATLTSSLSSHTSDTTTHGTTGDIVGTSDTQTLTNKTFGDNVDLDGNKIVNLLDPTSAQDAATKNYVDTAMVTNDWTTYSAVTPTSGTLDDPSFEIVFAAVDLSTTIYPGMRIRITQGTVKYFIVTKVAFSTNTTITLYGGTDYDLVSTGTTAITAFAYSTVKIPAGFPFDVTKWTVQVKDTTTRSQASAVQNTWYNPGSISISIPIGHWRTYYQVGMEDETGSAVRGLESTLSTANNSASDEDFTARAFTDVSAAMVFREKYLSLSTKTSYYQNLRTTSTGTPTIKFVNASTPNIIRAISAYL